MEVTGPGARNLTEAAYKRTEVGVIPTEWEVKPLHLLAEKVTVGIANAATHAYRDRGVVMFRNQNIKPNHLDDRNVLYIDELFEQRYRNKRLKAGDLLTARTGYPGTTSVVPAGYDGAQTFTTLITRPRTSIVDPNYLCFFINSDAGQKYIEQSQAGGGQKNVNAGSLKFLNVALPPSKAEQEAIADVLSHADALVDSLERLLAKKRQIKQGAMQELLTGKKRLPGFSRVWEQTEFGEIAKPRSERIDPRRTGPGQFCIELEQIEQATGRLVGQSATSQGSSLKSIFRPGDVLFGKLRAYLRKYWLADRHGVCSTEIWVLVAYQAKVTPRFLYQLVTLDRFIEAASLSYGTHMPRSDWNVVKHLGFPLPEIAEQNAIVAILSDMDAEIAAFEAQLAKARQLRQGMMHELLTGRIRLI